MFTHSLMKTIVVKRNLRMHGKKKEPVIVIITKDRKGIKHSIQYVLCMTKTIVSTYYKIVCLMQRQRLDFSSSNNKCSWNASN